MNNEIGKCSGWKIWRSKRPLVGVLCFEIWHLSSVWKSKNKLLDGCLSLFGSRLFDFHDFLVRGTRFLFSENRNIENSNIWTPKLVIGTLIDDYSWSVATLNCPQRTEVLKKSWPTIKKKLAPKTGSIGPYMAQKKYALCWFFLFF